MAIRELVVNVESEVCYLSLSHWCYLHWAERQEMQSKVNTELSLHKPYASTWTSFLHLSQACNQSLISPYLYTTLHTLTHLASSH